MLVGRTLFRLVQDEIAAVFPAVAELVSSRPGVVENFVGMGGRTANRRFSVVLDVDRIVLYSRVPSMSLTQVIIWHVKARRTYQVSVNSFSHGWPLLVFLVLPFVENFIFFLGVPAPESFVKLPCNLSHRDILEAGEGDRGPVLRDLCQEGNIDIFRLCSPTILLVTETDEADHDREDEEEAVVAEETCTE